MRLLSVSIFAGLLPGIAHAQSAETDDDLFLAVGGAVLVRSAYEGSSEIETTPIPYIELEYKQKYFLDGGKGAGLYLYRDGQTRLYTSIGFGFGREESEDERLRGTGDIDRGATLRVGGRVPLSPYIVAVGNISHQVTGSDTGTTATVGLGTRVPAGERLTIYPSVQATYADEDHAQSLFGLSEAQVVGSVAAGGAFDTIYEPDAGLKSLGATILLRYELNDRWEATGLASWTSYQGDIADSPIVEEDSNLFSIWGVAYRF